MVNLALCRRLWPAVLIWFVAADGASQASSVETQSQPSSELSANNPNGGRYYGSRGGVASHLDPTVLRGDPDRLRANLDESPLDLPECYGDTMRVSVHAGSRLVTTHDYCSGYSLGSAEIVTDARRRNYLLLESIMGHSSPPPSRTLTVFELTDYLYERARLLIDEPASSATRSTYEYRVATPAGGGLVISGGWTVDLDLLDPEVRDYYRHRTGTVLEIDTAPLAR
jgi:hypothetical protein